MNEKKLESLKAELIKDIMEKLTGKHAQDNIRALQLALDELERKASE